MPRLVFGTEPFIERLGRLSLICPRQNVLLVHLPHPLMQRALGVLTRDRHPSPDETPTSRWTVRLGPVPAAHAILLLNIEELSLNGLRETFHRLLPTRPLPVRDAVPSQSLPHAPAQILRSAPALSNHLPGHARARSSTTPRRYRDDLTERLRRQLDVNGEGSRPLKPKYPGHNLGGRTCYG